MSIYKHFDLTGYELSPIESNKNSTHHFFDSLLKGQLLFQIKLYGIPVEAPECLELHELCDIINDYKSEQLEVSKALINSACSISEFPPIEMLKRMSLKQDEVDKFEQKLLVKADEYNIPVNIDNPDFYRLEDDIWEWEQLKDTAEQLQINWDYRYYDVIGLTQEIEYKERQAIVEEQALHRNYISSRL